VVRALTSGERDQKLLIAANDGKGIGDVHKVRMQAALLIAFAAPATAVLSPLAHAGPGGGGPSGDAAPSASSHIVVLKGLRFHPSTITIDRGENVTWEWRDGEIQHNVTAPGFHSRTQAHGSFTVRFTHAGTFNYRCTIHEGMVGKVIVR
jgi:plastocyanin